MSPTPGSGSRPTTSTPTEEPRIFGGFDITGLPPEDTPGFRSEPLNLSSLKQEEVATTGTIPDVASGERYGLSIDPRARLRLAWFVKWGLLFGIVFAFAGGKIALGKWWDSYRDVMVRVQSVPVDDPKNAGKKTTLNHPQNGVVVARYDVFLAESSQREYANYLERLRSQDDSPEIVEQQKLISAGIPQFAGVPLARILYDAWPIAAILAAGIAAGIPRVLFPRQFGMWRDASEVIRDSLVLGVLTGLFTMVAIILWRAVDQSIPYDAFTAALPLYWKYRVWVVLVSALVASLISSGLLLANATRDRAGTAPAFVQAAVQAVLCAGLTYIWLALFEGLSRSDESIRVWLPIFTIAALLCLAASLGTLLWLWQQDRVLQELQKRSDGTGGVRAVVTGNEPVEMNITVIGTRESGKTVFMAGAYKEFLEKLPHSGFFIERVPEAPVPGSAMTADSDIQEVMSAIYERRQWPKGNVGARNFRFMLKASDLSSTPVALFNILDYPGGALLGFAEQEALNAFWSRIADSDAVLLVLDMSAARRGEYNNRFADVVATFNKVIETVIARNGRNRVVPVAIILTKCDEYRTEQGQMDVDRIRYDLHNLNYGQLIKSWEENVRIAGPGIIELQIFATSAITYSEPQTDASGLPDEKKPYKMRPGVNPIPYNCAVPLLWTMAKVMRWNITGFSDLKSFLVGHSVNAQAHRVAMFRLERLTEREIFNLSQQTTKH